MPTDLAWKIILWVIVALSILGGALVIYLFYVAWGNDGD